MGERRVDSMSTQYLGRNVILADAVDFSTSWNISFNHNYFYFPAYYSNNDFFTVGD